MKYAITNGIGVAVINYYSLFNKIIETNCSNEEKIQNLVKLKKDINKYYFLLREHLSGITNCQERDSINPGLNEEQIENNLKEIENSIIEAGPKVEIAFISFIDALLKSLKTSFQLESTPQIKAQIKIINQLLAEIEDEILLLDEENSNCLDEYSSETKYCKGELQILIYLLQKHYLITKSKVDAAEGFSKLTGFKKHQIRKLISVDEKTYDWRTLNPNYIDSIEADLEKMIFHIKKLKV